MAVFDRIRSDGIRNDGRATLARKARVAIGRNRDTLLYWFFAAVIVLALKQFYSTAGAEQLQWQLRPLVMLLELFSDLRFEPLANGEWWDETHNISIVKACAGINFLVIALLGRLWQQRGGRFRLPVFGRALLTAWLASLAANTLRVVLSVYGETPLSDFAGLSAEDSHRLIGIAVYFCCLWTQLALYRMHGFSRTVPVAVACYLAIALLFPLLRTWLLGLEPLDSRHAVWVAVVPAVAVVAVGAVNFISAAKAFKHSRRVL
ncbi:MAG: exosortase K [Gammaproteobacteria bacterium]